MQISRFIECGTKSFEDPDGREVVPAYITSTPSLVMIPKDVFDVLHEGDWQSLSQDHQAVLRDMGVLVEPQAAADSLRERRRQRHTTSPIRTFTLLPTSYCNMGCAYCGQSHVKGRIQDGHREAIRARVVAAIHSGRWPTVEVQWFGGEPLLAYNVVLDLADSFVAAAREAGVTYESQITTNGSLLSVEKVKRLIEAGVTRFDITLDGPAEIHDVSRPLKNGRGSFDQIMDVLREVVPRYEDDGITFILRTNITRENMDSLPRYLVGVADFAAGRTNVSIDLAPIHEWGNDVEQISGETEVVDEAELRAFRTLHELNLKTGILPSELSLETCVATDPAAEVIDRDGRMYSCVEYPLVPVQSLFKQIGHVSQLEPLESRPEDEFSEWATDQRAAELPCRTCSINPVCGGGCPKLWLDTGRGCPSMRRTVRARVDLAAEFAGFVPTTVKVEGLRGA